MSDAEQIPFEIEAGRVVDLLARQIYQTPLALLRENCQNAFDAILQRRALGTEFAGLIEVKITATSITVGDNGIGMSSEELRRNFWRAGASGKNTPEARAAGVVGTFGIGAMANFGIASMLEVTTESALTGERTRSSAKKAELSTTRNCILIEALPPTGISGTTVVATASSPVNIVEATEYLKPFVQHLHFPVVINSVQVSQVPYERTFPAPEGVALDFVAAALTPGLRADLRIVVTSQADVWIQITGLLIDGNESPGTVLLRQGGGLIATFRSGFGLAPVAVSSVYEFRGLADLSTLVPTAGREALSTASVQFLQILTTAVDAFVSRVLSERPESNNSTGMMQWALSHNRVEYCGNLLIRREPGGGEVPLSSLRRERGGPLVRYYGSSDRSILEANATDETPVYVLATRNPRRAAEQRYLSSFCNATEVSAHPQVIRTRSPESLSMAERGFLFRIASILADDYFVNADLAIGEISHGLPILLESIGGSHRLVFSAAAGCNSTVIGLYELDYPSFGSMVKDYVRSVVFPKIKELVPSATRQGAAAFLKAIERKREVFEYESADMLGLSEVWAQYAEGKLSFSEAAIRSRDIARASLQVYDAASARPAREVIADVMDNERVVASGGTGESGEAAAMPAIERLDTSSDAKVLVIGVSEPSLRGYRCFVSIADRIREERAEFFLQPHRTSVVWGGQRVLFIFQHISGEYGLYYDMQSMQLVADVSGGGLQETCTIVMKNRVYIPVPEQLQSAFVPAVGERRRFEVRCDFLFTGES